MEATLPGRVIIHRLVNYVDRLIDKRQQIALLPQTINTFDALHDEICRIEPALADRATRPNRAVETPKLLEPLTEQQKIIDLAG
jgi:hypothetical protein